MSRFHIPLLVVAVILLMAVDVFADTTPPEMLILNPESEARVTERRPPISVSFKDEESGVDLTSIRIFLDGVEATKKALITSTLISYLPTEDLEAGIHRVRVEVKDNAGNSSIPLEWTFTVILPTLPETTGLTGDILLKTRYVSVAEEPEDIETLAYKRDFTHEARLNLWSKLNNMELTSNIFWTSKDEGDIQPLSRYYLNLKAERYQFTLGDFYPSFSELSLSGKRVRGTGLKVSLFKQKQLKFNAIWGETKIPIEAKNTSSYGTFGQYLGGARAEYTMGLVSVGANYLSAYDDRSSIEGSGLTTPVENRVTSVDGKIRLLPIKTTLEVETSSSEYSPDVENKEFKTRNAWRAFSTTEIGRITVKGGYKFIAPDYTTLGREYLANDTAGWEARVSIRLLKNALSILTDFESTNDNVDGAKDVTTSTTKGSGQVSYLISGLNTTLRAGASFYRKQSDESTPLTDTLSTIVNAGVTTSLLLHQKKASCFSLNLVSTKYHDQAENPLTNDLDIFSGLFSWNLNFNNPFFSNGSVGLNQTEDIILENTTTYWSYSLRVGYGIIPEILKAALGAGLTDGSNTLETIKTQKRSYTFELAWKASPHHNLAFDYENLHYDDQKNDKNCYIEDIFGFSFRYLF